MKMFWIALLVLLVLVGCDTSGAKINTSNPATLRDDLFSVEPRNNGYYVIWLVHDDVAGYCTKDKTIGEAALKAIRSKFPTVVMTYRNYTTNDGMDWKNGCVVEGAHAVFIILTLEVLGGT